LAAKETKVSIEISVYEAITLELEYRGYSVSWPRGGLTFSKDLIYSMSGKYLNTFLPDPGEYYSVSELIDEIFEYVWPIMDEEPW